MESNEYKCAVCHQIFTRIENENWNEELAKEEFETNFPHSKWDKSTMDVICDDCWELVKPNVRS